MAAETLHEEEAEEEWRSSSKNQDAVPETRTIRKLGPVLGRQQLFVVRIRLAVGERLSFCCTRPLFLKLAGVSIRMEKGIQQSDSLAGGCVRQQQHPQRHQPQPQQQPQQKP